MCDRACVSVRLHYFNRLGILARHVVCYVIRVAAIRQRGVAQAFGEGGLRPALAARVTTTLLERPLPDR